tara:strand:+ start:537 stop:896 length:360 start_codon:yes stop_codon:yes gene_type:complete
MAIGRLELFKKRRLRVRNKLKRSNKNKVRMSVHRSSKNLYVQLIDDNQGKTLASASTLEKVLEMAGKNNVVAAKKLGTVIAKRANSAGIHEVYFDRGGFLFHGKIRALAEAAREGGLKF